jgi:hypothetical protein
MRWNGDVASVDSERTTKEDLCACQSLLLLSTSASDPIVLKVIEDLAAILVTFV